MVNQAAEHKLHNIFAEAAMNLFAPALAILLAGFALAGCDDAADARKQNAAIPVEAIAAYETTISDSVESLGTAMANESVDITANVTETISEIDFSDGQEVTKGDVIARLSQQEEAAQLAAAQARQKENRRELDRLNTLLKNKAAAQREYDERLTLIEVTKQEVEAIDARIADRTLRAPFDGVLGIRRVSVGALVQPGELITTIDDLSSIKLDFTVPSIYLSSLKVGTPIEAKAAGFENRVFRGEVASVNSRIDPVTRSVLVRALIPNEDATLKPGLLMQVTLLKDERQALVVPEESTIQRDNRHFVLVIGDDGAAEERQVQTGVRQPGMLEITDGLAAGEKVVTRGMGTVRAGQKVEIQRLWDEIRKPETGETPAATPTAETAGE